LRSKPNPQDSYSDSHHGLRKNHDEIRILRKWIKRQEKRIKDHNHAVAGTVGWKSVIVTPDEVQRTYSEGDTIGMRPKTIEEYCDELDREING
jgi:hypothetical protein